MCDISDERSQEDPDGNAERPKVPNWATEPFDDFLDYNISLLRVWGLILSLSPRTAGAGSEHETP